jgi:hypothetical protein
VSDHLYQGRQRSNNRKRDDGFVIIDFSGKKEARQNYLGSPTLWCMEGNHFAAHINICFYEFLALCVQLPNNPYHNAVQPFSMGYF